MSNKNIKKTAVLAVFSLLMAGQVVADKLDDVLSKGKVRCGVVLDFPPMGFRDSNNQAVGMDVDMCVDLATSMNVEHEIVGLTWAERIPSLISGKIDVAIASSSDTLERAQTVGFTIPYMKFRYQVLLSEDATAATWDDVKNLSIGAPLGTTNESLFLAYKKQKWADSTGKYSSYQSANETLLAVSQGQVNAAILSDTEIANTIASGKFKGIKAGPIAPFGADIVGMMTLRKEYGWINYLNLFINRQVRSGRFQELYDKWIGGDAPDMTVSGTYY